MKPGGNFIQEKCKNELSCTSMPPLLPLHKLWLFLCPAKLIRSTVARESQMSKLNSSAGVWVVYMYMYVAGEGSSGDFGLATEIPLDTNNH